MPITAARRTYSAIAVRPIPTDRGDHPIARSTGILQAQNFSNLPHRQSLGGHRTSNCVNRKSRTLPRSDCRQRPPSHPINRVAAFVRIGWPLSIGIGGRFASDSAFCPPSWTWTCSTIQTDLFLAEEIERLKISGPTKRPPTEAALLLAAVTPNPVRAPNALNRPQ